MKENEEYQERWREHLRLLERLQKNKQDSEYDQKSKELLFQLSTLTGALGLYELFGRRGKRNAKKKLEAFDIEKSLSRLNSGIKIKPIESQSFVSAVSRISSAYLN